MLRHKLIWATVAILISPHNQSSPVFFGLSGMVMVEAEAVPNFDIHPPGPGIKSWRLNTKFDNVQNWEGLNGYENCSQNIFSFPAWYDQEFVVTLPRMLTGKQVILPVNGHFVFREGVQTFLTPGAETEQQRCDGREVEFTRATTSDWFDPDNWAHHKIEGDKRSLLNTAIPHVERVPCHYDSAWFEGNSSFNLKISGNVTLAKFYFGDKKLAYSDVAILMNSELGKLQFQKAPETIFSITDDDQKENVCSLKGKDSDRCICSNYEDRVVKQKICSLAKCSDDVEDSCKNPVTPSGFCCPICAFHARIRHTGKLELIPLYTKIKNEISRASLQGMLHAHLSRYKEKGAHLIVLPTPTHLRNKTSQTKLLRFVRQIQSLLNQESEVIEVTVTESWGLTASDGGSIDRLEGTGLGGGLITLIVLLLLVVILAGIALFIFIWNRKHGYPPLTLSSVTSALPRVSSMRIPIVPGVGGGGRRSSTLSSSLHSFGFARFTNERMSQVTISPGESSEDQGKQKSSSIRRTDRVDDEPMPMMEEEKVTDATSGAFGYTNVTYDLVAGVEGEEKVEKVEEPVEEKKAFPVLTIPEVTVVEVGDDSTSEKPVRVPTPPARTKLHKAEGSVKEEEKKKGKPGFVASKLAKAYTKFGEEKSDIESAPKKGKKKGKKAEGTFKATRLEEDDSEEEATEQKAEVQVDVPNEMKEDENAVTSTSSTTEPIVDTSAQPQVQEGELVNLE